MSSCASGYRPTWDCRKHWKVLLWCVDWSVPGQGQVAGFCECGNELSDSIIWGNFLTSWEAVSFSRRPLQHSVRQLVSSTISIPFRKYTVSTMKPNVFTGTEFLMFKTLQPPFCLHKKKSNKRSQKINPPFSPQKLTPCKPSKQLFPPFCHHPSEQINHSQNLNFHQTKVTWPKSFLSQSPTPSYQKMFSLWQPQI